jgi:hypothetical protein
MNVVGRLSLPAYPLWPSDHAGVVATVFTHQENDEQ